MIALVVVPTPLWLLGDVVSCPPPAVCVLSIKMCLCADSIDRLVELEPRSTTVLIKWDYMSVPDIIVVMARLIGSAGQSSVATLNYTVTGSSVAMESACIAGLETETTYEVCLTPTFGGSTSQQPYCGFVTTNSVGSSNFTNDCFDPTITVPTQGAGVYMYVCTCD